MKLTKWICLVLMTMLVLGASAQPLASVPVEATKKGNDAESPG